MKAPREPNLRTIDPRLAEVRRRAIPFAGMHWHAEGCMVLTSDLDVCEAPSREVAQHICDAHNHLLPLINQMLFRAHSEEDLDGTPTKGGNI